MVKSLLKIEYEIEGISPLVMHKFNGQEEEKMLRTRPRDEQARKHAYLLENGNLAIPSMWIRGCILNQIKDNAGRAWKKEKKRAASRLQISPYMYDLGTKEFEVNTTVAPDPSGKCRDFCTRPLLKTWTCKGTIITTLATPLTDLKELFEQSGIEQGIGANRPNGFGRFKVTKFKKVADKVECS